ncbi:MAG TPA: type II toxin-antitoxin system VapC family toxin [Caulobacterales bacterium]|nr:type II toxin-antitoxin system VapC family toxin [Caulobacterales bacterium]
MVVDASALLAIMLREPDGPHFSEQIARAETLRMSVINLFEVMVRMDRIGASNDAERALAALPIIYEPVTFDLAEAARAAHLKFGKGRHPARLNMGDCFAYALATELGEPLLFKGGDFALTDVALAG